VVVVFPRAIKPTGEEARERESIDPRHSRMGQHRIGKMYFLCSGDSIDYFESCLPRVVFSEAVVLNRKNAALGTFGRILGGGGGGTAMIQCQYNVN
jgi:hypothetical protein